MSQPFESFGASSGGVVVEDLLLTEHFLIKGRIAGKYHRLSKSLQDNQRAYLPVEDAMMVPLRGGDAVRAKAVHVRLEEVLFAHELVDLSSDASQRNLARDQKTQRIRAFFDGRVQIEVTGRIEPGSWEPSQRPVKNWFIIADPVIRGLNLGMHEELQILEDISYAIVPKRRISYVYEV